MKARITLPAFLLIPLIVVGCAVGTQSLVPSSGQTLNPQGSNQNANSQNTNPNSSSSSVSDCRSHFDSGICEMIATVPPTECSASDFTNGQALTTPLTASGANSCLVTIALEDQACEAGYTWQQVQTLNISCH